jgi:hypothetical protein
LNDFPAVNLTVFAAGDGNGFAGRGIASCPLGAGARRERSKADQLHSIAPRDDGRNGFENRVNGLARAGLASPVLAATASISSCLFIPSTSFHE